MTRRARPARWRAAAVAAAAGVWLSTAVAALPQPATAVDGAVGSPAAASQPVPSASFPIFNDPAGASERQRQSVAKMEETLVRNTRGPNLDPDLPAALVQFTAFDFSDVGMAYSLLGDAWAGDHVEVLLDGASIRRTGCRGPAPCANPAVTALEQLNHTADPLTWLRTCAGVRPGHPRPIAGAGNGCLGSGLDHNKFLLTSSVDVHRGMYGGTVLVTSSNNRLGMYRHAYNDALVLAGQPAIYDRYERYFQELAAASASPAPAGTPVPRSQTRHSRLTAALGHLIESWTFPRPANRDPVPSILRRVSGGQDCRNPSTTAPGPAHTRVDVAMAQISGRSSLIRALVRLRQRDCGVSIIYSRISARDRDLLHRGHVRLHQLCTAGGDYLHSKFFLMSGTTRTAGPNRRLVYTGSENWTSSALAHSDDNLLQYVEPAGQSPVYDQYAGRFRQLLQVSKQPDGAAGACGP